jgi:hypothetical protein
MYFIKYEPLKEQLRTRAVTDRDALPYLILFSVFEVIAVSLPAVSEITQWHLIGTALNILVTVAGLFYVYEQNGGRDGYDIIQKVVVLGWVVMIRYLAVMIPISLVIHSLAEYSGLAGDGKTGFDAVLVPLLSVIYYERLGRHMADTTEKSVRREIN